jgi:aspartyl-tRNA synthetase
LFLPPPIRLRFVSEEFIVSKDPHFLWITEFPLFTRADLDKEFLAKGRWSSSHHPFTAPMWQDIEAMYTGEIESVRPMNTAAGTLTDVSGPCF